MTIKQKQNLLAYLGYYVGNIDGEWGTLSKTATVAFQKDFGLEPDGICGTQTEKALKHAVCYWEDNKVEEKASGDFWDEIVYFDKSEFACKCGGRYCNGFPVEMDEQIVRATDAIRKHFGKPANVNSGIRCRQHNANEGGVSDSQHLFGTAVDIGVISGTTPEKMAAYAETLLPNTGGIGIYSWGIHIDRRTTKSRWNG